MHIRVHLVRGESGRNPQLADSRPSGRLFYYRFEVIACTLQSLQAASPMLSSPQMRRADASARVRPIGRACARAALSAAQGRRDRSAPSHTRVEIPPMSFARRSRGATLTSTCANSEASNRLRLCTKMTICYEGIAYYSPCAMNMWSISSRFSFDCTVFGTHGALRRSNSLFLHNLSSILYTAMFPTPAFTQTSVPNWRAFVPVFPISYPVCLASHLV